MAIADQENTGVESVRRPSFDRAMVFGIFAPCLLFWAVIVAAMVKFF